MDQSDSEAMEPNNNIQNKIDLSKAEESTDLNNDNAETPTSINDNEITFTGMHNNIIVLRDVIMYI